MDVINEEDNDNVFVLIMLPTSVENVIVFALSVFVIHVELIVNWFAFNVLPTKVDKTRFVKLIVEAFNVDTLSILNRNDE